MKKTLAILLLALGVLTTACNLTPEQMSAIQARIEVRSQAHDLCTSPINPDKPRSQWIYRDVNNCVLGWEIAHDQGESWESFVCADGVVIVESSWIDQMNQAGGSAGGIPQALPKSKMKTHGADWSWNPRTQIRWMYDYMRTRYHSLCGALSARHAKGWY